ncbi:MAG: DUF4998 domain-containing protein [Muribaculaceae bacterium]|nr:DUF4998 domain-containing protein [Muribaculaceae bacterium]
MKSLYYIIMITLTAMFVSCDDMLDNIRPYLDKGETIYVGKADSLSVVAGRNRMKLEVFLKSGFSQSLCEVTMTDADGITVVDENPMVRTSGLQKLEYEYNDMKEGEYEFKVIFKDDAGNTSLAEVVNGHSYGDFYESTLANRRFSRISVKNGIVTINWKSIENALFTLLTYTTSEGISNSIEIDPLESTTVIEDAALGTEFTWCTYYRPTENALDLFKSSDTSDTFPL